MAIVLFTFIPINCAAPVSCDTALVAFPNFVFLINRFKAIIQIEVTTITNIVSILILKNPKLILLLFDKNAGMYFWSITFGFAPNIISARLSSKKLIPIAVISAEILGAFLIGRYAKKSITTPRIAHKTIDKIIATINGIPFDTAINVT